MRVVAVRTVVTEVEFTRARSVVCCTPTGQVNQVEGLLEQKVTAFQGAEAPLGVSCADVESNQVGKPAQMTFCAIVPSSVLFLAQLNRHRVGLVQHAA